MFKQSSFEKEIFEGMKSNLQKNASEQSLESKKMDIKIAQSLNALKDLLKQNNFKKQEYVLEKYIEKKASKIDVIKTFDADFNKSLKDDLVIKVASLLSSSGFGLDAVSKMVKEKENKYDCLFSKSASREVSYKGHQSVDMFNKSFVKDNQVLNRLSKLLDPLEKEIKNETVLDSNLSDDDFED